MLGKRLRLVLILPAMLGAPVILRPADATAGVFGQFAAADTSLRLTTKGGLLTPYAGVVLGENLLRHDVGGIDRFDACCSRLLFVAAPPGEPIGWQWQP